MLLNPAQPLRIGVGHRKGGTSKTTTAVLLALASARRFAYERTTLVDADATNDSASAWARLAEDAWPKNLTMLRWDPAGSQRLADFVAQNVDPASHLFIDTGPHAQNALADAMRSTNVFVVPLRPSRMEVVSLYPTLQIAATIYEEHPFTLTVLFAQTLGRTRVRREAIEYMTENNIPRLATEIPSAVAYNEAFGAVPRNLGAYPELLQELIEMGDTK